MRVSHRQEPGDIHFFCRFLYCNIRMYFLIRLLSVDVQQVKQLFKSSDMVRASLPQLRRKVSVSL